MSLKNRDEQRYRRSMENN